MFGISPEAIEMIVKGGGFALLFSFLGNVLLVNFLNAERKRAEAEKTERREIAKKYQDFLEDYNEKTAGNIAVISAIKNTLDNNTKILEGFKCRYLEKILN